MIFVDLAREPRIDHQSQNSHNQTVFILPPQSNIPTDMKSENMTSKSNELITEIPTSSHFMFEMST